MEIFVMNSELGIENTVADTVSVFDPLTRNIPFSSDSGYVFLQSLNVMVLGMFGIFCFMIVFYLIIKLLDRVYKDDVEKC